MGVSEPIGGVAFLETVQSNLDRTRYLGLVSQGGLETLLHSPDLWLPAA